MCDPVTISIGLAVVAGGVTAFGQVREGQAVNAQSKYEAKVADRNAKLSDASSQDARKRGERDQLNLWRKASQRMGEQRAQFGAAGVDVNFGTPGEVIGDTAMLATEDSFTTAENTRKEVEGFDIEGANFKDRGVAARMRGKAAKTAGYIGAAGTILGTASQVAGGFAPGGKYAKAS